MSIANYAELKILDHIGGTSWTAPTTIYIKLHTADPGEDGTTAAAANTTRQAVSGWSAASGGSKSMTGTLTWTSVPNTETYSHWSAWDNPTAGNCIWTGALSSSVAVTAGDNFSITSLSLTLD